MINSNTSFGKLKEVIVGNELKLSETQFNLLFKLYYKHEIGQDPYEQQDDFYKINYQMLQKRIKDLDNLANILENENIKVYRPKEVKKIINFETPYFKSTITPSNNVRDISFIYKDKIIETPIYVRNRYFENFALYDIFKEKFNNGIGGQWIKSPHTKLLNENIDLEDINKERDYTNINPKFEMAIDGAHFLRIGKDVIVNVRTYNHYLGFQWIKSLFPDSEFHMISIEYDHIDGTIICLKPGVFLVDPKYKNIKDLLPPKFKNWTILYPNESIINNYNQYNLKTDDIQLKKERIADLNLLGLSENKLLVKYIAYATLDVLEKNHFDIIPVELDDDEIFKGGIHCSTLDLVREDEYIHYT